jgi:hypothetical protein
MAQKKKPKKKIVVRITCDGSGAVDLDKLEPLQGNLKSLSDEDYERLKASIDALGFSFPVAAWKSPKGIKIIDAHQRVDTLKRMKAEGHDVPKMLPVVWIQAKDEKEAGLKILAATAQYGKIEVDGLNKFMKTFNVGIDQLESNYRFPEVDVESFRMSFFPDKGGPTGPLKVTEVKSHVRTKDWEGMPEFKQDDKGPFRSVIVHFFDQAGVDEFAKRVGQKLTDKTRMLWYPEIIIEKAADKRYGKHKK